MTNEDLIYVGKLLQGTELLCTGIYRDDFPTYEQFRQAGLKKLIKARNLFYDAFDSASDVYDRDSLRTLLDTAEDMVRDLQLAKTL